MFAPGHTMRYGDLRLTAPALIRPAASGFATVRCHGVAEGGETPGDGGDLHPREAFATIESIIGYLDGCERWRLVDTGSDDMDDWRVEKVAGPYTVVVPIGEARIGLACTCGWMGKLRAVRARRYLNADQSRHRCIIDKRLDDRRTR